MKTNNMLLLGGVVLALAIAAFFGFRFYQQRSVENVDVAQPVKNPKKGDIGYVEKNRTIVSDDETRGSGKITKMEGGEMQLEVGGVVRVYGLTADEVAVQCTSQPLENATSVDMNLVSDTKIITPDSVIAFLNKNVFVLALKDEAINKVHTIFVSEADCVSFDTPVSEGE